MVITSKLCLVKLSNMNTDKKRKRLYGKPATEEQIAKENARLLLGDPKRGIMPKTVKEICQILSYESRETHYKYRRLAIELGYLSLDENDKPILPEKTPQSQFKKFTEDNKLNETPLGKEWVDNMFTRKGGKPIKSWKQRLVNLTNWLNTLEISPEQLLVDLETTDRYATNFLKLYQEGKAKIKYRQDPSKSDIQKVAYVYAQAYRDFMNYHGLPYPKNYGGVSSQKVVGHGQYADVELTDEEIISSKQYLIEKYGICSDEFRFFMMGVESCGRHDAVFKMTLDYSVEENEDGTRRVYVFEMFEGKAEHIKGGKWKKYVTDEQLQESIDDLKKKGINRLNEEELPKSKLDLKIKTALLDLYVHLGKNTVHKGYFMAHYFHVLRHVGAHYWLRKTGYNHSTVAKVGGWNVVQELVDSYGETPPSVILKSIFGN